MGYHLHNYITYKHVRNPHVWDMGPQLYLTSYPLSSPTTDMDSYGVSSAFSDPEWFLYAFLETKRYHGIMKMRKQKHIQGPNPVQTQC